MSSASENTSHLHNYIFYIMTVLDGNLYPLAVVGIGPLYTGSAPSQPFVPVSAEFVAAISRSILEFLKDPKHRCPIGAEVSSARDIYCNGPVYNSFPYLMTCLAKCIPEDEQNCCAVHLDLNFSCDEGSMNTPVVFNISKSFIEHGSVLEVTLIEDRPPGTYCKPMPERSGDDIEAKFAQLVKTHSPANVISGHLASFWKDQTDICLVSASGLRCAALTLALGENELRWVQRLSFAASTIQNESREDLEGLAFALSELDHLEQVFLVDIPTEPQTDASETAHMHFNFRRIATTMGGESLGKKIRRCRMAFMYLDSDLMWR